MKKSKTRVERIIKLVKGPLILDVGCTGHIVDITSDEWLHEQLCIKFNNVYGVDTSIENVGKLIELGYKNISLQNAEDFVFNIKFDTIVAGELIEHLSNPGSFLENSINHLKPDGQLIITTPNPFSLIIQAYAYLKYPRTCQNNQHTMWFCPSTMRELTNRYNLKIKFFDLIYDYSESDPSKKYRFFVKLLSIFKAFIPKRLTHNTMLFVLIKP